MRGWNKEKTQAQVTSSYFSQRNESWRAQRETTTCEIGSPKCLTRWSEGVTNNRPERIGGNGLDLEEQ